MPKNQNEEPDTAALAGAEPPAQAAEEQAAPAVEADSDDGVLYRIGAPWAGITRYECIKAEGCKWDSLDRDSAVDHYMNAHPYTGPAQRVAISLDDEGVIQLG